MVVDYMHDGVIEVIFIRIKKKKNPKLLVKVLLKWTKVLTYECILSFNINAFWSWTLFNIR